MAPASRVRACAREIIEEFLARFWKNSCAAARTEIDPLPSHLGRLLVLLIDLAEARRLALGFGDGLFRDTLRRPGGSWRRGRALPARLHWRRSALRSERARVRNAPPARRRRRVFCMLSSKPWSGCRRYRQDHHRYRRPVEPGRRAVSAADQSAARTRDPTTAPAGGNY